MDGNYSAVTRWWGDFISFLHPVFLWSLLWGQNGIFFKLYRNIKSGFDPSMRRRRRLISWLEDTTGRTIIDLDSVWKDGSVLCDVIRNSCPGAFADCQHFGTMSFQHGQNLVAKYLRLQPAFTEADFLSLDLTLNLEKRLFCYITSVRQAVKRHLSSGMSIEEEIENEIQIADKYIARGMGLVTATKNHKSIFYIYSRDGSSLEDINIEIRGPQNDFGTITVRAEKPPSEESLTIPIDYRLTKEFVKVCYQPKHRGHHELSLTKNDSTIPGSPFLITVDEITEADMSRRKYNSIEWLTEEEEEERRVKLEQKKKNSKVLFRIVDFVTEKMYLTDDGKLVKIDGDLPFPIPNVRVDSLKPPETKTSPRSLGKSVRSPRSKRRMSLSPRPKIKRCEKRNTKMISTEKLKKFKSDKNIKTSDASSQVGLTFHPDLFHEKCTKIVKACDFLLKHSARHHSLEILSKAGNILENFSVLTKTHDTMEKNCKQAENEDKDDVFLPGAGHNISIKMNATQNHLLSSLVHDDDGLNDMSTLLLTGKENNEDGRKKFGGVKTDAADTTCFVKQEHSAKLARISYKQEGNTKSPNKRQSFSSISHEYSEQTTAVNLLTPPDDILTVSIETILPQDSKTEIVKYSLDINQSYLPPQQSTEKDFIITEDSENNCQNLDTRKSSNEKPIICVKSDVQTKVKNVEKIIAKFDNSEVADNIVDDRLSITSADKPIEADKTEKEQKQDLKTENLEENNSKYCVFSSAVEVCTRSEYNGVHLSNKVIEEFEKKETSEAKQSSLVTSELKAETVEQNNDTSLLPEQHTGVLRAKGEEDATIKTFEFRETKKESDQYKERIPSAAESKAATFFNTTKTTTTKVTNSKEKLNTTLDERNYLSESQNSCRNTQSESINFNSINKNSLKRYESFSNIVEWCETRSDKLIGETESIEEVISEVDKTRMDETAIKEENQDTEELGEILLVLNNHDTGMNTEDVITSTDQQFTQLNDIDLDKLHRDKHSSIERETYDDIFNALSVNAKSGNRSARRFTDENRFDPDSLEIEYFDNKKDGATMENKKQDSSSKMSDIEEADGDEPKLIKFTLFDSFTESLTREKFVLHDENINRNDDDNKKSFLIKLDERFGRANSTRDESRCTPPIEQLWLATEDVCQANIVPSDEPTTKIKTYDDALLTTEEQHKKKYLTLKKNINYVINKNKSISFETHKEGKTPSTESTIFDEILGTEHDVAEELFRAEPAIVVELYRAEPAIVEELYRAIPAIVIPETVLSSPSFRILEERKALNKLSEPDAENKRVSHFESQNKTKTTTGVNIPCSDLNRENVYSDKQSELEAENMTARLEKSTLKKENLNVHHGKKSAATSSVKQKVSILEEKINTQRRSSSLDLNEKRKSTHSVNRKEMDFCCKAQNNKLSMLLHSPDDNVKDNYKRKEMSKSESGIKNTSNFYSNYKEIKTATMCTEHEDKPLNLFTEHNITVPRRKTVHEPKTVFESRAPSTQTLNTTKNEVANKNKEKVYKCSVSASNYEQHTPEDTVDSSHSAKDGITLPYNNTVSRDFEQNSNTYLPENTIPVVDEIGVNNSYPFQEPNEIKNVNNNLFESRTKRNYHIASPVPSRVRHTYTFQPDVCNTTASAEFNNTKNKVFRMEIEDDIKETLPVPHEVLKDNENKVSSGTCKLSDNYDRQTPSVFDKQDTFNAHYKKSNVSISDEGRVHDNKAGIEPLTTFVGVKSGNFKSNNATTYKEPSIILKNKCQIHKTQVTKTKESIYIQCNQEKDIIEKSLKNVCPDCKVDNIIDKTCEDNVFAKESHVQKFYLTPEKLSPEEDNSVTTLCTKIDYTHEDQLEEATKDVPKLLLLTEDIADVLDNSQNSTDIQDKISWIVTDNKANDIEKNLEDTAVSEANPAKQLDITCALSEDNLEMTKEAEKIVSLGTNRSKLLKQDSNITQISNTSALPNSNDLSSVKDSTKVQADYNVANNDGDHSSDNTKSYNENSEHVQKEASTDTDESNVPDEELKITITASPGKATVKLQKFTKNAAVDEQTISMVNKEYKKPKTVIPTKLIDNKHAPVAEKPITAPHIDSANISDYTTQETVGSTLPFTKEHTTGLEDNIKKTVTKPEEVNIPNVPEKESECLIPSGKTIDHPKRECTLGTVKDVADTCIMKTNCNVTSNQNEIVIEKEDEKYSGTNQSTQRTDHTTETRNKLHTEECCTNLCKNNTVIAENKLAQTQLAEDCSYQTNRIECLQSNINKTSFLNNKEEWSTLEVNSEHFRVCNEQDTVIKSLTEGSSEATVQTKNEVDRKVCEEGSDSKSIITDTLDFTPKTEIEVDITLGKQVSASESTIETQKITTQTKTELDKEDKVSSILITQTETEVHTVGEQDRISETPIVDSSETTTTTETEVRTVGEQDRISETPIVDSSETTTQTEIEVRTVGEQDRISETPIVDSSETTTQTETEVHTVGEQDRISETPIVDSSETTAPTETEVDVTVGKQLSASESLTVDSPKITTQTKTELDKDDRVSNSPAVDSSENTRQTETEVYTVGEQDRISGIITVDSPKITPQTKTQIDIVIGKNEDFPKVLAADSSETTTQTGAKLDNTVDKEDKVSNSFTVDSTETTTQTKTERVITVVEQESGSKNHNTDTLEITNADVTVGEEVSVSKSLTVDTSESSTETKTDTDNTVIKEDSVSKILIVDTATKTETEVYTVGGKESILKSLTEDSSGATTQTKTEVDVTAVEQNSVLNSLTVDTSETTTKTETGVNIVCGDDIVSKSLTVDTSKITTKTETETHVKVAEEDFVSKGLTIDTLESTTNTETDVDITVNEEYRGVKILNTDTSETTIITISKVDNTASKKGSVSKTLTINISDSTTKTETELHIVNEKDRVSKIIAVDSAETNIQTETEIDVTLGEEDSVSNRLTADTSETTKKTEIERDIIAVEEECVSESFAFGLPEATTQTESVVSRKVSEEESVLKSTDSSEIAARSDTDVVVTVGEEGRVVKILNTDTVENTIITRSDTDSSKEDGVSKSLTVNTSETTTKIENELHIASQKDQVSKILAVDSAETTIQTETEVCTVGEQDKVSKSHTVDTSETANKNEIERDITVVDEESVSESFAVSLSETTIQTETEVGVILDEEDSVSKSLAADAPEITNKTKIERDVIVVDEKSVSESFTVGLSETTTQTETVINRKVCDEERVPKSINTDTSGITTKSETDIDVTMGGEGSVSKTLILETSETTTNTDTEVSTVVSDKHNMSRSLNSHNEETVTEAVVGVTLDDKYSFPEHLAIGNEEITEPFSHSLQTVTTNSETDTTCVVENEDELPCMEQNGQSFSNKIITSLTSSYEECNLTINEYNLTFSNKSEKWLPEDTEQNIKVTSEEKLPVVTQTDPNFLIQDETSIISTKQEEFTVLTITDRNLAVTNENIVTVLDQVKTETNLSTNYEERIIDLNQSAFTSSVKIPLCHIIANQETIVSTHSDEITSLIESENDVIVGNEQNIIESTGEDITVSTKTDTNHIPVTQSEEGIVIYNQGELNGSVNKKGIFTMDEESVVSIAEDMYTNATKVDDKQSNNISKIDKLTNSTETKPNFESDNEECNTSIMSEYQHTVSIQSNIDCQSIQQQSTVDKNKSELGVLIKTEPNLITDKVKTVSTEQETVGVLAEIESNTAVDYGGSIKTISQDEITISSQTDKVLTISTSSKVGFTLTNEDNKITNQPELSVASISGSENEDNVSIFKPVMPVIPTNAKQELKLAVKENTTSGDQEKYIVSSNTESNFILANEEIITANQDESMALTDTMPRLVVTDKENIVTLNEDKFTISAKTETDLEREIIVLSTQDNESVTLPPVIGIRIDAEDNIISKDQDKISNQISDETKENHIKDYDISVTDINQGDCSSTTKTEAILEDVTTKCQQELGVAVETYYSFPIADKESITKINHSDLSVLTKTEIACTADDKEHLLLMNQGDLALSNETESSLFTTNESVTAMIQEKFNVSAETETEVTVDDEENTEVTGHELLGLPKTNARLTKDNIDRLESESSNEAIISNEKENIFSDSDEAIIKVILSDDSAADQIQATTTLYKENTETVTHKDIIITTLDLTFDNEKRSVDLNPDELTGEIKKVIKHSPEEKEEYFTESTDSQKNIIINDKETNLDTNKDEVSDLLETGTCTTVDSKEYATTNNQRVLDIFTKADETPITNCEPRTIVINQEELDVSTGTKLLDEHKENTVAESQGKVIDLVQSSTKLGRDGIKGIVAMTQDSLPVSDETDTEFMKNDKENQDELTALFKTDTTYIHVIKEIVAVKSREDYSVSAHDIQENSGARSQCDLMVSTQTVTVLVKTDNEHIVAISQDELPIPAENETELTGDDNKVSQEENVLIKTDTDHVHTEDETVVFKSQEDLRVAAVTDSQENGVATNQCELLFQTDTELIVDKMNIVAMDEDQLPVSGQTISELIGKERHVDCKRKEKKLVIECSSKSKPKSLDNYELFALDMKKTISVTDKYVSLDASQYENNKVPVGKSETVDIHTSDIQECLYKEHGQLYKTQTLSPAMFETQDEDSTYKLNIENVDLPEEELRYPSTITDTIKFKLKPDISSKAETSNLLSRQENNDRVILKPGQTYLHGVESEISDSTDKFDNVIDFSNTQKVSSFSAAEESDSLICSKSQREEESFLMEITNSKTDNSNTTFSTTTNMTETDEENKSSVKDLVNKFESSIHSTHVNNDENMCDNAKVGMPNIVSKEVEEDETILPEMKVFKRSENKNSNDACNTADGINSQYLNSVIHNEPDDNQTSLVLANINISETSPVSAEAYTILQDVPNDSNKLADDYTNSNQNTEIKNVLNISDKQESLTKNTSSEKYRIKNRIKKFEELSSGQKKVELNVKQNAMKSPKLNRLINTLHSTRNEASDILVVAETDCTTNISTTAVMSVVQRHEKHGTCTDLSNKCVLNKSDIMQDSENPNMEVNEILLDDDEGVAMDSLEYSNMPTLKIKRPVVQERNYKIKLQINDLSENPSYQEKTTNESYIKHVHQELTNSLAVPKNTSLCQKTKPSFETSIKDTLQQQNDNLHTELKDNGITTNLLRQKSEENTEDMHLELGTVKNEITSDGVNHENKNEDNNFDTDILQQKCTTRDKTEENSKQNESENINNIDDIKLPYVTDKNNLKCIVSQKFCPPVDTDNLYTLGYSTVNEKLDYNVTENVCFMPTENIICKQHNYNACSGTADSESCGNEIVMGDIPLATENENVNVSQYDKTNRITEEIKPVVNKNGVQQHTDINSLTSMEYITDPVVNAFKYSSQSNLLAANMSDQSVTEIVTQHHKIEVNTTIPNVQLIDDQDMIVSSSNNIKPYIATKLILSNEYTFCNELTEDRKQSEKKYDVDNSFKCTAELPESEWIPHKTIHIHTESSQFQETSHTLTQNQKEYFNQEDSSTLNINIKECQSRNVYEEELICLLSTNNFAENTKETELSLCNDIEVTDDEMQAECMLSTCNTSTSLSAEYDMVESTVNQETLDLTSSIPAGNDDIAQAQPNVRSTDVKHRLCNDPVLETVSHTSSMTKSDSEDHATDNQVLSTKSQKGNLLREINLEHNLHKNEKYIDNSSGPYDDTLQNQLVLDTTEINSLSEEIIPINKLETNKCEIVSSQSGEISMTSGTESNKCEQQSSHTKHSPSQDQPILDKLLHTQLVNSKNEMDISCFDDVCQEPMELKNKFQLSQAEENVMENTVEVDENVFAVSEHKNSISQKQLFSSKEEYCQKSALSPYILHDIMDKNDVECSNFEENILNANNSDKEGHSLYLEEKALQNKTELRKTNQHMSSVVNANHCVTETEICLSPFQISEIGSILDKQENIFSQESIVCNEIIMAVNKPSTELEEINQLQTDELISLESQQNIVCNQMCEQKISEDRELKHINEDSNPIHRQATRGEELEFIEDETSASKQNMLLYNINSCNDPPSSNFEENSLSNTTVCSKKTVSSEFNIDSLVENTSLRNEAETDKGNTVH